VQQVATMRAKTANRLRRWVLAQLMRLPGGKGDLESLLSRFPAEALLPLRRNGLDPVPALGEVRDRAPVSRLKLPLGLRGWLVTGYAESRAVLADSDTYSNDFSNMVGKVGIAAEQDPGGLGFADPPAHTRLRHMLTSTFTTRALSKRTDRVREIIDEALDEMQRIADRDGVVDLHEHFAVPIPSRVILEVLGVGDENQARFQQLSTQRFDFAGGAGESLDTIQEAIDLLVEDVRRQRVEGGSGLIGAILSEYGDDVSDIELAGLADGVLTGGLETTVSMIALGTLVLLRDEDARKALGESDDYTEAFVEELLRYLTVVQVGFPRFARRDVTLGGQQIFAGDVVLCSLSAANRDPRHGTDMDTVDLHRPPAAHLAFGHGIHRCVGAELARIALRLAYPALVRRFPDMRLAIAPEQLSFRETSFVYGVNSVPVTLG
jgi:cytochrome P450